jgi:hypothetical protein
MIAVTEWSEGPRLIGSILPLPDQRGLLMNSFYEHTRIAFAGIILIGAVGLKAT